VKEIPAEEVVYRSLNEPEKHCTFSAGLVEDLPPENVYLKFEGARVGEPLTHYLRKDEAQAIIFVLSAALWALEMHERKEATNE